MRRRTSLLEPNLPVPCLPSFVCTSLCAVVNMRAPACNVFMGLKGTIKMCLIDSTNGRLAQQNARGRSPGMKLSEVKGNAVADCEDLRFGYFSLEHSIHSRPAHIHSADRLVKLRVMSENQAGRPGQI
jgi:hypothetical protein